MRDAICSVKVTIWSIRIISTTVAAILFSFLATNYYPVKFLCIQYVSKGAWAINVVSFSQTRTTKLTDHVFFTLLEVSLPTVVLILPVVVKKEEEEHNLSF